MLRSRVLLEIDHTLEVIFVNILRTFGTSIIELPYKGKLDFNELVNVTFGIDVGSILALEMIKVWIPEGIERMCYDHEEGATLQVVRQSCSTKRKCR